MKRTSIAIVVLVAILFAVQHFGLERAPEKLEENRASDIGSLRPTRILPQYIASLFMGAFRAIAVDVLWVQMGRLRREHRYFETVELMDMISSLQPRNAEVWVNQSWDAAYNIANHVRDPEEQWRWIRKGLEKLEEGSRHLSHDPYLKEQMGYTLVHKATWNDGVFQTDYLSRVEQDRRLQVLLLGRDPGHEPRSAFELAIPWYERAMEDLERMKREQRWRYLYGAGHVEEWKKGELIITQVGRVIHLSSVDGEIYLAKFFNAFYALRLGRRDKAQKWFRDAAAHARGIAGRYANSSPIFKDYAELCDSMAEACTMPASTPGERLALLRAFTPVLAKAATKDFWHLSALLTALKRECGGDEHEFNDDIEHTKRVPFEELIEATLHPEGDVDIYEAYVRQPEPPHADRSHRPRETPPFPLHRVGFQLKKDGDVDLKATLWTFHGGVKQLRPAKTQQFRTNRWEEIDAPQDMAGHFLIFVEALGPGRDPRYLLRWSLAEPAK